MEEMAQLTAVEGFVVGDAEVLEHVGVAGEQWRGKGQEGGAGGEEDGGELLGPHGQDSSGCLIDNWLVGVVLAIVRLPAVWAEDDWMRRQSMQRTYL